MTLAICASAPGRPQMTSSKPEIIMLQSVRPPALKRSMRARISASSQGIFGPPVSTWSTPICFTRRMPASSTVAQKPRQIFGVSLPSAGIRENAGRVCADALRADDTRAAVPMACSSFRREMRELMGDSPFSTLAVKGGDGVNGFNTKERRRNGDARKRLDAIINTADLPGLLTATRQTRQPGADATDLRPVDGATSSVRLRCASFLRVEPVPFVRSMTHTRRRISRS